MNKNMETEYQNLDWAIPIVKQQLKECPHSKISTIFNKVRNHPRLSIFGDYPLFLVVIKELRNTGKEITKTMIRKALKISSELKNRETIVDGLFNG